MKIDGTKIDATKTNSAKTALSKNDATNKEATKKDSTKKDATKKMQQRKMQGTLCWNSSSKTSLKDHSKNLVKPLHNSCRTKCSGSFFLIR